MRFSGEQGMHTVMNWKRTELWRVPQGRRRGKTAKLFNLSGKRTERI